MSEVAVPVVPVEWRSSQFVYDMTQEQVRELTRRLLENRPVTGAGRFCSFELEGSDPYSNLARHLELDVFGEKFGNDSDCLTSEYGPYEESSLFFLVIDSESEAPAAAMRMIRNSPVGLKTLVDMGDDSITPTPVSVDEVMMFHGIDDLDRCWDCGSAVVGRQYRNKPVVFISLVRAWYAAARRDGIEHLVSILAPLLRRIAGRTGVRLVPLVNTPPFFYMEAPDHQAVYAHLPTANAGRGNRVMGRMRRFHESDAYAGPS